MKSGGTKARGIGRPEVILFDGCPGDFVVSPDGEDTPPVGKFKVKKGGTITTHSWHHLRKNLFGFVLSMRYLRGEEQGVAAESRTFIFAA
jgi:hypothetical protein